MHSEYTQHRVGHDTYDSRLDQQQSHLEQSAIVSAFRTHTGMALPLLPRLTRLAMSAQRRAVRARSYTAPPPRSSCTPTPAPPCPPCEPAPRPPCRARAPERVQALRVTCCPPARGSPPPCPPPLPACSRDCSQARPPTQHQTRFAAFHEKSSCDAGQDLVAARLAASKEMRRQQYLREVRARRPAPPPCDAPYRLLGERECARAHDGRELELAPAAPRTASRACGPCREQPPPRCIEIVPDNECQPRGQYVDPCEHKPRIIVNIDRSKTQNTSSKGVTSRLMKIMNLSRSGDGMCSTKHASSPSGGAGVKAQYAGDTGWCGNIQPQPAPVKCRPPGAVERLRRRACRDIPCSPQTNNKRTLHTTATTTGKKPSKDMKTMAADTKANMEKLEKMLNTRAQLKDAATGRSISCTSKVALPATGGLELPVPAGAQAVRIQVSLDPARIASVPMPSQPVAPPSCSVGTEKASACAAKAAATTCSVPSTACAGTSTCVSRAVPLDDKTKSWLSIKTLQRKIVETCRLSETSSKDTGKNPCGPKPSPCGPKPSPGKSSPCAAPPARKTICPPPKAPSKKSNCDEKKKPTCFTPALATAVSVYQ